MVRANTAPVNCSKHGRTSRMKCFKVALHRDQKEPLEDNWLNGLRTYLSLGHIELIFFPRLQLEIGITRTKVQIRD